MYRLYLYNERTSERFDLPELRFLENRDLERTQLYNFVVHIEETSNLQIDFTFVVSNFEGIADSLQDIPRRVGYFSVSWTLGSMLNPHNILEQELQLMLEIVD